MLDSLSEIRPFDLVASFGGDEFVFMFPSVTAQQALEIAGRIREKINCFSLGDGSFYHPVQLSGGISSVYSEDIELQNVLKRADVALQKAKVQGRNCVVLICD